MRNMILLLLVSMILACGSDTDMATQTTDNRPMSPRMESEHLLEDKDFHVEQFLSCQDVHYRHVDFQESDTQSEHIQCQFLVSWSKSDGSGLKYGKVSVYPEYNVVRYEFWRDN